MSHPHPSGPLPLHALASRTLAHLVAERPGRARTLDSLGIDYCCAGGRTLHEACDAKALPLETALSLLASELADPNAPNDNPAELPPERLVRHIVRVHHAYLRRELPRLRALSQETAETSAHQMPVLREIAAVFAELEAELESHMMKEEQILFPIIEALGAGEEPPMPLDCPIHQMVHEHDIADAAMTDLRRLTHGFQPHSAAGEACRTLFTGLRDLENDLHRHIHLENWVLFPAARAIANG